MGVLKWRTGCGEKTVECNDNNVVRRTLLFFSLDYVDNDYQSYYHDNENMYQMTRGGQHGTFSSAYR